jgi:PKD repeat protein
MFNSSRFRIAGLSVAAISLMLGTACTLSKDSAPPLSGPSEFGTSVVLSASPEVLVQDGSSRSVVTATVRDTAGKPMAGVALRWTASTTGDPNTPFGISDTTTATDGNGQATITVTAPRAPVVLPTTPDSITVQAAPVADSANQIFSRIVTIRLQPPAGTPPSSSMLTARFAVAPTPAHVGDDVRFDASTSTAAPGTVIATYTWSFGDGTGDVTTTPTTSHAYTEDRIYPVTLTVTDNLGTSSTTAQQLTVLP